MIGRTAPCALYTGEDYERCQRFHMETRREMRTYRFKEGAAAALVGVTLLAGLGIAAVIGYGVVKRAR